MEPSSVEVAELMARVAALRAAMGKLRADIDVLADAEQALADKLRTMGLDDTQTTVDLPTIPGLPSRRKRGSASVGAAAPARDVSPMKAAAIGAALTLGLALVILLAVNIQLSRHSEAANAPLAASAPTVPALVVTSPPTASAPATNSEPAPAPSASADSKPEMGALTIVCTPRCDSIVDNGTPLSPGNLVAVPVVAGAHKIVVSGNGTKRTFSVTISPGQTRDLRASLENPVDRGF